jgi:uncharacterized protein YicC (UPF0701 family)
MYTALLIFLIINALIMGLFVASIVYMLLENRTKVVKRCGVLEHENKVLASQCNWYNKRLVDYKAKMPLKAKYRLNEKVVCVIKDKVIRGIIKCVLLYENEVVEYQIEVINNKDKTISNTMTILESYVYPDNTLKVGEK